MKKQPKNQGRDPAAPSRSSPEEQQLEEALERLPAGTVCKVYRLRDDGEREFLFQVAPIDATEEVLAKRAGAGRFHLLFYGRKSAEQPGGYRGSATVRIGEGAVAQGAAPPAANPGMAPGDRVNAIVESGLINLMNTQTAMLERLQRPGVDWAAMLPPVLAFLGTILAPLLTRKDDDSFAKAQELAQLLAKANRPQSSLEDLQKTMEFLRTLREQAGSGEAGEDSAIWSAISRALPLLERLIPAPAPPVAAGPPVPAIGAPVPGASATPAPGTMPDELSALQPALPALVQWAQQGRNPEWCAETLCYEIPPSYYGRVVAVLQRPGIVMQIGDQVPALRPSLGWLEAVRVALVQQMTDAQGGGDGGGGGGAGGAGADGGAG